MLKFYFNGSPNPTKVALFLEEAGLPYEADPGRHAQGRAVQAGVPGGQSRTARCRPSSTATSTVFDSNAILLYLAEKTGKFLPHAGGARRAAVVADVRGHRHRTVLRPGRALQAPRAGEGRLRPQPLPVRGRSATTASSTRASPSSRYMVGDTYTHRRHGRVGLGAAGAVHHGRGRPGRSSPTSSGWSTRSAPVPRRRARSRSRTSTPSRPRWTTRRAATCSSTSRRRAELHYGCGARAGPACVYAGLKGSRRSTRICEVTANTTSPFWLRA